VSGACLARVWHLRLYVYDGAHKRIKETSTTAGGTTTTWYLGSYEELTRSDGVTERRHWIQTPDGPAGTYTSRSDGTTAPRYWMTDHLGSVVGEVDQTGTLKQSASFGAWGDRTQVVQADPRAEDRGFTGHEHLTEVNLVHMNGRVYDPVTGRFLAADPLIQDPYDAQNYNRYSYVRNNPLSFTDPSGYSWWTKWRKPIAAIAVGAFAAWAAPFVGGVMGEIAAAQGAVVADAVAVGKAATVVAGGFAAGGIQGGNIESAVAGAVSAGAFFAAGSLAETAMGSMAGFGSGEPGRMALHAVAGCASGAAAGGSCGRQAAAGAFSELAGPVIAAGGENFAYRVAAHSVAGGLGSLAAGGTFENGAVTGAFGYLFNDWAHNPELARYGFDAHQALQRYYDKLGYITESKYLGALEVDGRFDIGRAPNEIWEIKRDSIAGRILGEVAIRNYTTDTGLVRGGDLVDMSVGGGFELQGKLGSYRYTNVGAGLIVYSPVFDSPGMRIRVPVLNPVLLPRPRNDHPFGN